YIRDLRIYVVGECPGRDNSGSVLACAHIEPAKPAVTDPVFIHKAKRVLPLHIDHALRLSDPGAGVFVLQRQERLGTGCKANLSAMPASRQFLIVVIYLFPGLTSTPP